MTTWQQKLQPRLIGGYWSIQGSVPVLGRVRKQFPDQQTAQLESEKLTAQVSNKIAGGQIRETLLTKAQEADAHSALRILESNPNFPSDWSLAQVVTWAGKAYTKKESTRTILEACEEWIQEMVTLKRSEVHMKNMEQRIARLSEWFPDKNVSDITTENVRQWISDQDGDYGPFAGRQVSVTTRTNELTTLKSFFNFCEGRKFLPESPVDKSVKSPGINRGEIIALDLGKVREIMTIASGLADKAEAVPYFALSLFAGLRPHEIRPKDGKKQIMWEDFTWRKKESTLVISYAVGKVTSRRVIKLPQNCVDWVKPYAKESGPVIESSFATWRGIKDLVRARAGYKVRGQHFKHLDPVLAKVSDDQDRTKYVADVLRHTAISYYLEANDNNKDLVANWAGNSPAVIDQHYRSLIKGTKELSPSDMVKEYWNIKPMRTKQSVVK
jgi:integrase